MLVTQGFMHDRAMSLHRRAYEVLVAGGTQRDWAALALRLDCPREAIDQIWRTATSTRDAGMSAQQAFPLMAEIERMVPRDFD